MPCRSCASENQKEFGSEISIHFPGRKGLDRTAVLVFPRLVICTNCGFTEFTIPMQSCIVSRNLMRFSAHKSLGSPHSDQTAECSAQIRSRTWF